MIDSPIQEIKDRLPVADVLADYVQLKKAGTYYKGLCPFHNEKTPSFMVSPAKQVWRCYGCGLGGDIFEFIKLVENVEFYDALKILADRAGIELKKPTAEEIKTSAKKHTLYDINMAAAKYFEKVLWESRSGNEGLMYLRGRGLTDQTIKNWQLGFAPDDFHYLENFLIKTFPKEDIVLAGLAVQKDDGSVYDRFRGRVMFPIHNIHGQVVGFTGRILKDQKLADGSMPAKYVNSPETPVYNKGKELYGLHLAKNSIRKENRAVLVEGNMDVIASHQAGVSLAIASSGTALTSMQVATIKRFTENMIFAFDTDSAGAGATRRALEEALNQGFNVKIADMRDAKDPDEMIRKGVGLWKKAVDSASNFAEYFFDKTLQKADINDVETKRQVAKELAPLILHMSDPVTRGHFVRKLSKGIDVAEQAIWDIISKLSLPKPNKPPKGLDKRKTRREILEEQLLGLSLATKDITHLKDFGEQDFTLDNREVHKLLLDRGLVGVSEAKKSNPQLSAKLEFLTFASEVEANGPARVPGEQVWNPNTELLRVKAEFKKLIHKDGMLQATEDIKLAEKSGDAKTKADAMSRYTHHVQEYQKYEHS